MKYEIMFVVRPNLEEDKVKEVSKNFEKILTDNGAKITSSKDLGQKELAYEIKGHKAGYYFLINLEANDAKAIDEFNRLARISEDVIRHLIVKEDE